jgi:8-oxo-dGTP pyrophosphatase MutT (NUDIX family)
MSKISHDSESPAHGQQVITATAIIWRERNGVFEVFLPRRAATKKFLPSVFETPGGHIDFGEHIVDGLKREIREELGMEINVGDPLACFTYTNNIKGSHSIEVCFFATLKDPDATIVINPEDHSDFKWLTRKQVEDLKNEITPPESSGVLENGEDPEYRAILKAFDLLEGNSPDFATRLP